MRSLLLFFFSLLAGCSSTATGHSDAPVTDETTKNTSTTDPLPGAGEPCACTLEMHGSPPPENCCAAGLLCRDPAHPHQQAPYSCSSASNTCTRSGTCVDASLPPVPPPSPGCVDTCNPMDGPQSTCDVGYECHLVGACWACI